MKLKKLAGFAMALAMTVSSTGLAHAATVNYDVVGGYFEFNDETNEIVRGTNGITIMEIPSRINDIPVTSISEGKYYKDENWGSYRPMDFHVTQDGYADGTGSEQGGYGYYRNGGFYGCTSIASVKMNTGLQTIKPGAFMKCTALKQVIFSDTLRSIENDAFNSDSSLASLDFPESLCSIGDGAFKGCSGLNSVKFAEGIVSVGNNAFEGCKTLRSITFPESLITIGESGFKGCNNITEINFNKTLTAVENNTFENCISLEKVEVPANITRLGVASFKNTGLKEITLNEGLYTIDNETFADCITLKTITIPKSVGSIGTDVFTGSGLRTVYCYKNSIADNAKLYPTGTNIYYLDAENPTLVKEILSGDVDGDGKITAADAAMVLQKALNSSFQMKIDGIFKVAE